MANVINLDNYNSFSGADVVVTAQMNPINGNNCKTHILSSLQTISYSTHQDRAPVRAIGNINALDYVQGQRTIAGTMVFAMFDKHWMTPLLEELSTYTNNTDIWSDELPALNLTLSVANEYGYKSNMAIYGVIFIDDGGVMSINDLYTENTLQFLATGIEPLHSQGQYKHSSSYSREGFTIVSPDKTNKWKGADYESYRRKLTIEPYVPNPGKSTYVSTPGKDVKMEIKQPIKNNGKGIVNFYMPEDNKRLNIYITDLNDPNFNNPNFIHKPNTNQYTTEIGIGEYNVVYEDPNTGLVSSPYSFNIKYDENYADEERYPIIYNVSDDEITFIPNNINHDKVILSRFIDYPDISDVNNIKDKIEEQIVLDIALDINKEMTISNLKPNTIYSIGTFNSESESNKTYFKTFKSKQELYDIFKEYVLTNSDLFINKNILNFDFDKLDIGNNNIIDAVLKIEDSDIKNELLIYAKKLQNEISKSFNDYSVSGLLSSDYKEPLKAKFEISSNIKSIIIRMNSKGKSYYVNTVQANNNYEFIGKNYIRYTAQPILNNNKKGNCIDFLYFSSDLRNKLSKYENVNNLSNTKIINYKNNYKKYNGELLDAINAYDNFYLYKNILEPPYAIYDNKVLTVNVNYKDILNDNNDYFLCIANYKDVLDHTPIRKIRFKPENESLNIESYYSGVLENSYYLLWIENNNYDSISLPYILSTFSNDLNIIDFYNEKIKDKLKIIKDIFDNSSASFKSLFDNIYLNMLSENTNNLKDLPYKIIANLLSGEHGFVLTENSNNLIYAILSLFNIDYENRCSSIQKDGSVFSFNNVESSHMSTIYISNTGEIIKNSYNNFSYNINTYNSGYTILYLIEHINYKKSGFVLINNETKEYFICNLAMEVK